MTVSSAVSPAGLNTAGVTAATPSGGAEDVSDLLRGSFAGRGIRRVDDHGQRAVEARPEPFGQEVVGLALGGVQLAIALVGQPEAQVQSWDGEGDHRQNGSHQHSESVGG